MARPVILSVDDEPQVLNAIERDLRQHYGRNYRIAKAGSGQEALKLAQRLKQRGEQIAIFLADQRMPEMTGTEFLTEAMKLEPDARKVLLTAYADTEAAVASINVIGLDYYLMKPWDPPEDRLFPVLDDLLSTWATTVVAPYDGIRVAGTLWSEKSHQAKEFLARNRIPYQWLDIERDTQAMALVESVEERAGRLPVLFFPEGDTLVDPDNRTLADRVGLQTQATQPFFDVIVVGAGPAGLGAAVYGGTEGLRTALIERHSTGGQAGTSSRIENYLGFPNGVSGSDLAQRASTQARRFGVEILTAQEVTAVRVDGPYRIVVLDDGTELSCHALVIATGVALRRLEVPGAERLTGAGVYYGAAATEASLYKGQRMFVVGGANSAGQGAMFFSRYADKVTMLVRGNSLEAGMSQYLVDQIRATSNIDVLLQIEVAELEGDDRLERVVVRDRHTGETNGMAGAAMFIFIGAAPYSDLVSGVVERTEEGFIVTGPDLFQDGKRPKGWMLARDPFLLETSVPGIFAAGDIRQGVVRRVASAVGEGAIAISFVHQYLKTV